MCTRVVLPRLLALRGSRVDGHLERKVEVAPQLTGKRFNSCIGKVRKQAALTGLVVGVMVLRRRRHLWWEHVRLAGLAGFPGFGSPSTFDYVPIVSAMRLEYYRGC